MTADRNPISEAQIIYNERALRKIIIDPDFTINNAEIIGNINVDRLGELFPLFNSEGLDEDRLWSMYFIAAKIDKAKKKVMELKTLGKTQESEALGLKVDLILNFQESQNSDLGIVYNATDSLNMCVAFLGLSGEEGNKKWVDFIIRSWGKIPTYSK